MDPINPDAYEYDVAFSFVAADEPLAQRLNDLVQDGLHTFLYSKRQEELAGRDGEELFSTVFGAKARLVVVLYREAWGTTPWTRIERDAIRNRSYEKGYDFTLWIPLDSPARIPQYVPKTRLWADIYRFGENGIAAVIVRLAAELGATFVPETLEQKTQRAGRAADAERRRVAFHGPGDGVRRARQRAMAVIASVNSLGFCRRFASSGKTRASS